MTSLVSIGVPTYNRPEMLRRALTCIARQDHGLLDVHVGDNASDGDETLRVVEAFRSDIPGLRYTRHDRNIGSLANFQFLLREARGPYFMWLADDDEVTPNYVSVLAGLLERNPQAAAAAGHWKLMTSPSTGTRMPTSSFPQRHALTRAVRFIVHSDDAFFYAVHRVDVLRQARFPGYYWPNQSVLLNWAYVYLFDVLLRGQVLLSPDSSVQFINHDYTPKSYTVMRRSVTGLGRTALRRLNVHFLYWMKASRHLGFWAAPPVIAASAVAVASRLLSGLRKRAPRGTAS